MYLSDFENSNFGRGYLSDDFDLNMRRNAPMPCQTCTYFVSKRSIVGQRESLSGCGRLDSVANSQQSDVTNRLLLRLAKLTSECEERSGFEAFVETETIEKPRQSPKIGKRRGSH